MGGAIVGKAHTHLAVVAKGRDPHDPEGEEWFYPSAPAEWSARRTYTELVVRDASQVLPLGYLNSRYGVCGIQELRVPPTTKLTLKRRADAFARSLLSRSHTPRTLRTLARSPSLSD